MPIDLKLNSFLDRIKTANDNDTLVMKDSAQNAGNASVRGFFRTLFTSSDRYRETTRQFIDKFCNRFGDSYKDTATSFFKENLEGSPLSVRTVRSFLNTIKINEDFKAERNTRFDAACRENPRFLAETSNVRKLFETETALFSSCWKADKGGLLEEVMKDLCCALKNVPQNELANNSLVLFAKDLFNNITLSKDQIVKRLNLLMAFVDWNNAASPCVLDYHNPDPAQKLVLQRLFSSTDAKPEVLWGNPQRILGNAFLSSGSVEKRSDFVDHLILKTPQDFAARVSAMAEKLKAASMAELKNSFADEIRNNPNFESDSLPQICQHAMQELSSIPSLRIANLSDAARLVPKFIAASKFIEKSLSQHCVIFANAQLQNNPQIIKMENEISKLLTASAVCSSARLQDVLEHNLFLYAKCILNDASLSADQVIKRLTILKAFIDPLNTSEPCALPNSFEIVNAPNLFQAIMEVSDDPNFNLDSPQTMLAKAISNLEVIDPKAAPIDTSKLKSPADFTNAIDQLSKQLTKLVTSNVIDRLKVIFPNKSEQFWASMYNQEEIVSFVEGSISENPATVNLRPIPFSNFSQQIAACILTKMSTKTDMLCEAFPDIPVDFITKRFDSHRKIHPELFLQTLEGKDKNVPRRFVDSSFYLGLFTTEANGNSVTFLSPEVSEQWCTNKAVSLLSVDLFRFVSPNVDRDFIFADPAKATELSYSYFVDAPNGQRITESPYANIPEIMRNRLSELRINPNTVSQEKLDEINLTNYVSQEYTQVVGTDQNGKPIKKTLSQIFTESYAKKVFDIALNKRQACIAISLLCQAQEDYLNTFNALGGTCYNKGICVDAEGNLHVTRISRPDSPVFFFKDLIVTPDGKVMEDTETLCLTTDLSVRNQMVSKLLAKGVFSANELPPIVNLNNAQNNPPEDMAESFENLFAEPDTMGESLERLFSESLAENPSLDQPLTESQQVVKDEIMKFIARKRRINANDASLQRALNGAAKSIDSFPDDAMKSETLISLKAGIRYSDTEAEIITILKGLK